MGEPRWRWPWARARNSTTSVKRSSARSRSAKSLALFRCGDAGDPGTGPAHGVCRHRYGAGVVVVAGTKGEARISVRTDESGAPVLPAAALMSALDGSAKVVEGWAEVTVGSQ